MSEEDRGSVSTIGERLKAAREAKKMSLEEVASKTRIPVRHLQHIEQGEWDALPAHTYSVGFARSYANAVGLNGNEIGAELRQEIGPARQTYEAPAAYYEPADPARVPPRSLAIVAGIIAVLLIVGYVIWRAASVDGSDVEPQEAVVEEPVPAGPTTQAAAPPPATGPVVLTATDEVWLRVYEASGGAPLFEGVLNAGQRYQVPATAQAPQIRTGRPQALRVTVGSTEIPPLGEPETTIDDVSLLPADLAARASGTAAGALPPPGPATQPQPGQ